MLFWTIVWVKRVHSSVNNRASKRQKKRKQKSYELQNDKFFGKQRSPEWRKKSGTNLSAIDKLNIEKMTDTMGDSSLLLRPTVNRVVREIVQKIGIRNPHLEVKFASKNGDSYSGEVYRITVRPQDDENNNVEWVKLIFLLYNKFKLGVNYLLINKTDLSIYNFHQKKIRVVKIQNQHSREGNVNYRNQRQTYIYMSVVSRFEFPKSIIFLTHSCDRLARSAATRLKPNSFIYHTIAYD